jgi:hypothetical protein
MFNGPIKTTSYDRFYNRINDWKFLTKIFPRLRHYFWWIIHNCIAHMLIGFFPIKKLFEFHDYTSDKINGYHLSFDKAIEEDIKTRKTYIEKKYGVR